MASTVLPNGIIIPEKYSRDWYNDLYHNWQELDNLLGGGTPKDGTLAIQKNGTTVGTFSANQATDETINITVPDVNNGTLTIQQNGTTVDTFSANSSSDKTVNISVPTKTSDLNNDSGFITGVSWNDVADKPSFATVATSGSYNDLSNKPTIPTVNNATLTIQQNGTTVDTFTANSSSDKTVNIQCVDLSSNQTVGGQKIFSHGQIGVGRDIYHFAQFTYGKNTPPANTSVQYIWFSGNTASQGFANSWYSGYLELVLDTNGSNRGRWLIRDTSENPVGLELWTSGNDKQVRPYQNNTTDLGTATRKWKSFNGINPGALSLPSISNTGANAWIALDTTNWVASLATSTAQKYTPPADGWLNIRVDNAVTLGLALTDGGNYMHQMVRSETPSGLALLLPVFKNKEVAILVGGNENFAYTRATFYPCQGNI